MFRGRVLVGLVVAAAMCSSGLVGCGSVRLVQQEGQDIRLLEEEEATLVRTERRVWFWLWGAKALSDDTPATEIEEHQLEEIRIESKQTVLDVLLSAVGGVVGFVCRTIVVEGNS